MTIHAPIDDALLNLRGRIAHMAHLFNHYGYGKGQEYAAETVKLVDEILANAIAGGQS